MALNGPCTLDPRLDYVSYLEIQSEPSYRYLFPCKLYTISIQSAGCAEVQHGFCQAIKVSFITWTARAMIELTAALSLMIKF